jgi:signal transduction histidine kinase
MKADRVDPRTAAGIAWAVAAGALGLAGLALAAEISGTLAGTPPDNRDWVLVALCLPIGARVAAHAPRNPCGWLILSVGALAGITLAASVPAAGPAVWLRDWIWWPGYGLLILAALLFPDGKLPSPRWRPFAVGIGVVIAAGTVALGSMAWRTPGGLTSRDAVLEPGLDWLAFFAATVGLFAGAVLTVVALVARLRRTRKALRGPIYWAAGNAVLLLVAFILDATIGLEPAWLGTALAIPAATTVGVMRYGLYDIGLLIHRSLLYGVLTVAAVGVYAAAVTATARVAGPAAAPIAAAATVVAVLPLRQAANRLLLKMLYGQGGHPYELVVTLGRRIGLAHTPDEVVSNAVAAIGEGLKAPYTAIYLGQRPRPEAAHGRMRQWPVTTLPLTYRGRAIGLLLVQQRSPDEPWSRRERILLADLTRQLGPPAASLSLTRDLQAARERLVRAREEELRRLQRDLHDGIGPALAAARLMAQAALTRTGDRTLSDLESDLADAATELRRIVDGLRPPALDRGLAAALQTAARRHGSAQLTVSLEVDGDVKDLPAAVEVATYRVVDEALANVVKHAQATQASVTVVRRNGFLRIAIDDDGCGVAQQSGEGVGLESMRLRCQELGAELSIQALAPGTRITTSIPLG